MSKFIMLRIGDQLRLLDEWFLTVQKGRLNETMWRAVGCEEHPTYTAATLRSEELLVSIQDIYTRAAGPKKLVKHWDGDRYVDRELGTKLLPGDTKRLKAIHKELEGLDPALREVPISLPADTIIQIEKFSRPDDVFQGLIRFDVLATSHLGLLRKSEGGSLGKGKRSFLVRGDQFCTLRYAVVSSSGARES